MARATVFTYRIEIYSGKLLLSGSYNITPYKRLSDAMNISLSSYMTLHDAIISPLNHPEQVQPVSHVMINRHEIPLIAALREPAPPADYTPPRLAGKLERVRMMFFTQEFVIQADLAKRPDRTVIEMLDGIEDLFVPITNAKIFPLLGGQPMARDFACLGRAHIQALYPLSASDDLRPADDEASLW
ncbi:MAG: hypothetical protein HC837_16395 [Chloroflexaceae bacterium]|nr:hypothetical protein [Chloroflexaceae bacterium]